MKLEVITVAPKEQRVLLLFDPQQPVPEDQQARTYLQDNDLEPKRQYQETRDSTDYDVYYFGHCYVGDHLNHLVGLASESKL